MTNEQYAYCLSEIQNYTDEDAYVSDLSLSVIWNDDEETWEIPIERIEAVRSIWEAYHRPIKEIAKKANMSCRKLAERFCIPYRTMEDWSAGKRECPVYTKLMMQECLGIIKTN